MGNAGILGRWQEEEQTRVFQVLASTNPISNRPGEEASESMRCQGHLFPER
jgi:hypothetical protein